MDVAENPCLFAELTTPPVDHPSPAALDEGLRLCLRMALGHELPNQLVAIQGLARVLDWEEADRLSEAGNSCLRRLSTAAERTHRFVHTLAHLLRPKATHGLAAPVPFLDAAQEAVTEVGQLLRERSVMYQFEGAGVLLPVPRLLLVQVLVQLLRNAVQSVGYAEEPTIRIAAHVEPAGVSLSVTDRGRGFPPELLAQLEDFLAGRIPTLGTGFGLLFVQLVVRSWAGRLHVTSAVGQGSTVTVTLPPE